MAPPAKPPREMNIPGRRIPEDGPRYREFEECVDCKNRFAKKDPESEVEFRCGPCQVAYRLSDKGRSVRQPLPLRLSGMWGSAG